MAFGNDVGAFAQGLLGGMNTASQIRTRNVQAAYYGTQLQKETDRREAVQEARTAAERRTGGGGGTAEAPVIMPPSRVTTEAIPGGLPEPDRRPRGYAEGGVVRPAIDEEALVPPPPAAPVAPATALPAPPAPPAQAVTPPSAAVTPEGKPEGGTLERDAQAPDPVRGALNFMRRTFGLDQSAQQGVSGAAPAGGQGLTSLLRGEGAESNEVMDAARQRVDPKGELPLARRNAVLLEEMSAAFYRRGMIEEGDRASASVLQNFRRNMSMYGAFAVQAAESGNFQQAAQLLDRAYAYVPDGNDMQVRPVEGGLQVQQIGPDGKPRGEATMLRGAEAVRNAVGYAMDFDNWAKHLLSERTLNENVRLREASLAETGRHNRATEGLSAAALAETRSHRRRGEERETAADASFQSVRAAQVEERRAVRALEALSDDATPEQRQAARQKVEEARTRVEDMEARMPARAAGALSQIEGRDAAAEDRRRNTDSQIAGREAQVELTRLKTRLTEERDPAERRKIEAQIGALERRGTGRSGAAPRDLTFDNRGKIEDAFEGLETEGMTPEALREARPLAQGLASVNRDMGPREAAETSLALRRGQFRAAGTTEAPAVVVNGRTIAVPPGMTAMLGQYYRQGNQPPPERTGPGLTDTLGAIGRGLTEGPESVRRARESAAEGMPTGSSRTATAPQPPADPAAMAAANVERLLRSNRRLPQSTVDRLIRAEATKLRVPEAEVRRRLEGSR